MRRVRSNTLRDIQRWNRVRRVVFRYGFEMVAENGPLARWTYRFIRACRIGGPVLKLSMAERLRLMLQDLGPTYVKLGQVLASRSEILPPDWIEELSKLHDTVAPVPYDSVQLVFVRELGIPPERVFQDFDARPMAAASMAQVHGAVLPDNQPVVVKVQRPNIEVDVQADLHIMLGIADILEQRTAWASKYGLVGAIEEFASGMVDELDCKNEAQNFRRLACSMNEIPGVHVPEIYADYVTRRLLTMERINGVRITNVAAIDKAGLDREALASTFIAAMMKQILIDGFFHADPHPGNVLVDLETGTINFIDVGLAGFMLEEQRWLLISLIFALKDRNSREVTKIALELGKHPKGIDEAAFRRDMERFLNRYMTDDLADMEFSAMMSEMFRLMLSYRIQFPRELTLALKALAQAEEIARALNPHIDIVHSAHETGQSLMSGQLNAQSVQRYVSRQLQQTVRRLPKFQTSLDNWFNQLESGKFTVHVDHSDLVSELQQYRIVANRAIVAIIVVAMIIGSAVAMNIPSTPELPYIPVFGAAGFALAVLLGLYLILQLLRGSPDQ